jgi:glycosyltransferase involved in cell wall biosynthesis
LKLALIQDQLLTPAGSERVFLYMIEEFSEADYYTLAYNPKTTWPEYLNFNIRTSFLNGIIKNHKIFQYFFPISTYVMQNWDFSKYDIILSSSATTAKYINRFTGKHICYCYTPTRAIWSSDEYFQNNSISSIIKKRLLHILKKRDISSTKNISRIITQSLYANNNIKNIYSRDSDIIPPPIEYNKFSKGLNINKSDHYLIVSRLEKWKKIDFAIHAFNDLGYKLKIIGTGTEENYLKSISSKNIEYLGSVNDDTLVREYGNARAVIFTPELEYGLIPIEANAAGTIVIGFEKGAIQETMIPYNNKNKDSKFTSILFDKQTPDSIKEAIVLERKLDIDRIFLTTHAKRFDVDNFKKKIRNIVEEEFNKTDRSVNDK